MEIGELICQLNNKWNFGPNLTWVAAAAAAAKSLQSCSTLCDPMDGSPWGSPIPGILQARTLEWVAISFSNAGKWKVKVKSLSRIRLFTTPWTAAYQAPLSVGFSRQEYWSGVPLPSLTWVGDCLLANPQYECIEIFVIIECRIRGSAFKTQPPHSAGCLLH